MKTLSWIITIATILIFSTGLSFGGTVFGSVKDENGNPVVNAEVKIYGKDIKTKTDKNGKFKIVSDKLIDGNRYSIKVNAEGFDSGQTLSTEIFDDPEEMESLDVVLYKAEPIPEPPANVNTNDLLPPGIMPQDLTNNVQPEIIEIKEEVKEEITTPAPKTENKPAVK